MKMPKRGEKGFTLIELLIVIAILGVLAAVIIPNVGRFFGRGEDEARKTEKDSVQAAVDNMMADNGLASIPTLGFPESGAAATNNMNLFPDSTSEGVNKTYDPTGAAYDFDNANDDDLEGYRLNGHDIIAEGTDSNDATAYVDYIREATTVYYYTCEADGTVYQYADASKTPVS